MSCPNSSAPKCCAPPKKPCPPAPPACSNLPATKTFTCPAEECPKKEEKPCPCPPKEEKCVALGKAQPEPCGGGGGSSSSGAAPAASSGAKCAGGGNADNSCEVKPLSMVRSDWGAVTPTVAVSNEQRGRLRHTARKIREASSP